MKDKILLTITYLISKRTFTYSLIIILTVFMIAYEFSKYISKIEQQEKQRIMTIKKLDKDRLKFIDSKVLELKPILAKEKELKLKLQELQSKINIIQKCINGVKTTIGTLGRYDCNNSIIPKVSASEDGVLIKMYNNAISGGVGTDRSANEEEASSEIPTTLKPNDLFYTTKKSDKCHISQNEQSHFTKAGGHMLATDVACDFDKDGKADQAEVYAPDYLDNSVTYTIAKKHDDLLGDYIELLFNEYNDNPKNIIKEPRNKKWVIGHTTTKLKDGDVVETGQRIGQNNLTGYTTGYHSHIELWSYIDGKWKNISYTTRSETLNNKRNNILSKWKEGDKFYFTSYHIGDVNQNDSSPYIGASGKDLRHISNPIALTIDVRKSLGIKWGDKVKLSGPCTGIYQVEDEMNKRFRYSNIMKDGVPIKGDIAIPLGTEAQCSGIYSITKI